VFVDKAVKVLASQKDSPFMILNLIEQGRRDAGSIPVPGLAFLKGKQVSIGSLKKGFWVGHG
jgi:hypothetical protein